MPTPPRVRFAPSPTGDLHVGGLRTALFNWLFARRQGGRFVLRIEDTDRERLVPGSEERIEASLRWLGLTIDEGPTVGGPYGPYVQSERLSIYQEHAQRLLASDHAYECHCSPERLAELRQRQQAARQPPAYDRHCRFLRAAERETERSKAPAAVVRLKVPESGTLTVEDLVRGHLSFNLATVDDAVLLKSDGFPTYHLANVVDDHLMAVSHVIRAEEWLPSLPKHRLLYDAFGWSAPAFAHVPLLLGPDRSKLSKRHGAVAVQAFIEAGYLSEAMFNFLALLGWNPGGNRELMSREEIIAAFSLDRIQPAGAVFDRSKLDWMNLQYLKRLPLTDFAAALQTHLRRAFPMADGLSQAQRELLARAVRDRIKRFDEAATLVEFVFHRPSPDPQLLVPTDGSTASALAALRTAREHLSQLLAQDWTLEAVQQALDRAVSRVGQSRLVLWPVRVAVTGRRASPPVYESVALVGQSEALERLDRAVTALQGLA